MIPNEISPSLSWQALSAVFRMAACCHIPHRPLTKHGCSDANIQQVSNVGKLFVRYLLVVSSSCPLMGLSCVQTNSEVLAINSSNGERPACYHCLFPTHAAQAIYKSLVLLRQYKSQVNN